MPYIAQEDRHFFNTHIKRLSEEIKTPGELNYVITKLILLLIKKESYAKYNEVIGVLECVKLELYRMQIAKYEEIKKEQNGEII